MLKRITLFLLSFLLILCLLSCKASDDIAKEVLDYEQELRNEIDKLNKEKPQYIRSYDKVCSVFCTYEFFYYRNELETARKMHGDGYYIVELLMMMVPISFVLEAGIETSIYYNLRYL